MQLALNLISEEKLLELLEQAEEGGESFSDDEGTAEDSFSLNPGRDALDDEELEMIVRRSEDNEDRAEAGKDNDSETDKEGVKAGKKGGEDTTIKDIVRKINRKFGIRQKKKSRKEDRDYLFSEFFGKDAYNVNVQELFSYLGTGTVKEVYKPFYTDGSKDRIYNFEDELISYDKMCKIQSMAKMAHYMGYKGNIEYCGHETLDADTKERWNMIRNMSHVLVLSFLRYELSMS